MDDNPVECAAVRRVVPQVDVIALPSDPSYYVRSLSQYLMLETASFTAEDSTRTKQYRARAEAARLEQTASSVEELWQSLDMTAEITPFDEISLPRVVQLIGKTNQFNLTTRRHGQSQIEAFMRDPDCLHFSLRLRDRFADHGLVGVMIAIDRDGIFEIDTWLMSCRVIGRTVENAMLAYLCACAAHRGITTIRGLYFPTAKNQVVRNLYRQMGFSLAAAVDGGQAWLYDLAARGPVENRYIELRTAEHEHGYTSSIAAGI